MTGSVHTNTCCFQVTINDSVNFINSSTEKLPCCKHSDDSRPNCGPGGGSWEIRHRTSAHDLSVATNENRLIFLSPGHCRLLGTPITAVYVLLLFHSCPTTARSTSGEKRCKEFTLPRMLNEDRRIPRKFISPHISDGQ